MIGTTNSGKRQTGNFFMKTDAFVPKFSLKPVTTAPTSSEGMIRGVNVKIIYARGFLDSTCTEESKELAEAIKAMPDGVDAVGFVINLQNGIKNGDIKLLETLLTLKKMIPHTFIIFTHAKVLGKTEKEQEQKIKETLSNADECPDILHKALSNINNRFMLLESVEPMGEDYHERKSQQLLSFILEIICENNKKYNSPLGEFIKHFNHEGMKTPMVDLQRQFKDVKLSSYRQLEEEQRRSVFSNIFATLADIAVRSMASYSNSSGPNVNPLSRLTAPTFPPLLTPRHNGPITLNPSYVSGQSDPNNILSRLPFR